MTLVSSVELVLQTNPSHKPRFLPDLNGEPFQADLFDPDNA
jgi:hypothetical protein